MPNDPHIKLIVKSTSGKYEDRFNRSNRAQKILDEAIRYFGLTTGGARYTLKRESNNRELDLAEKIRDLGLTDGEVLILQSSQPQDG